MDKVIVGRHINGITLNGLEWLLHEDGTIMEFGSEQEATNYLLENGICQDVIDCFVFRHSIGVCSKCGSYLYPSQIEGYVSQCFTCDEDFYGFEQETDCYAEMSCHDLAELVYNSRHTNESFSFYAEYDAENNTAQWAYEIRVVQFADSLIVIGNYWGGGSPFCDDITDDSDSSGLESLLKIWMDNTDCGETVWLKNYKK